MSTNINSLPAQNSSILLELESNVFRAAAVIHLLSEIVSEQIEGQGWEHGGNVSCGILQLGQDALDGLNLSVNRVSSIFKP